MATAITESIDTVWSTWLEGRPLDGIFDLANTISSAGGFFADVFTEQVLDPIQEQIDELSELGDEALSELLDTIGLTEEELQDQLDAGGTLVLEPRFDVVEDQLARFLNNWGLTSGELQDIFNEITSNFTLDELRENPMGIAQALSGQFGLAWQEVASIINSIVASTSLSNEENTLLGEYLAAQAERNALEQEYLEQQERILALQEQQQKLDFLKQQFDLIKALTEAGLDPADILDGITLGLDASVPDLIEAMTVALQALVQAANDELEIGSPSKVFATIGGQMMAGINTGIADTTNSTMGYMEHAMASIASTQYHYPPVAGIYNQSTSVDKSVTINVDAHYAKQQLPGHIGADIAALMYNVVW